ncbi:hypothetical protein PF008_g18426 [Phytophthora fragariae]|uniref:Retroviral polymerase SH3-like domain-containing protein n=1 Tax=Phytophthora fragariae TaxID=53985 RepID=A0A6G0R5D7_9STRA|nr:hypothetical protein PF008_g18426 [Phytophthora fragariae]
MFGVKPDVHHIRKFGSLAYVHVPISPDKQKQDANAYVAFVLGYAEDTVGCKVYIPSERTVKFVAEVRVQGEIMYRDRHDVDPADVEATEWLQFTTTPLEEDVTADPDNSEYDVADSIVAGSDYSMSDTNDNAQSEINTSVSYEANENKSTTLSVSLEWGDDSDTDSVSEEHDEINESVSLQRERNLPAAHDPDTKSVSAECGSVAESVCSEIDDTASDNSDDATSDKNDDGVSDKNLATATEPKEPSRRKEQTSDQPAQIEGAAEETGSGNQHEIIILPPVYASVLSEMILRPKSSRMPSAKIPRRDAPAFVKQRSGRHLHATATTYRGSNMAIRVLGKDRKPIQASNIRIPRIRREAMRL